LLTEDIDLYQTEDIVLYRIEEVSLHWTKYYEFFTYPRRL